MATDTNTDTNAELLELVRSLSERVESLEIEVKSLRLLSNDEVSEDIMVAIAAAVAAYLGHRARKRQPTFARKTTEWQSATRRSQLNHAPIHLR
jgi:methylmalonyl-CoA carboxyltransferase 12S subunit